MLLSRHRGAEGGSLVGRPVRGQRPASGAQVSHRDSRKGPPPRDRRRPLGGPPAVHQEVEHDPPRRRQWGAQGAPVGDEPAAVERPDCCRTERAAGDRQGADKPAPPRHHAADLGGGGGAAGESTPQQRPRGQRIGARVGPLARQEERRGGFHQDPWPTAVPLTLIWPHFPRQQRARSEILGSKHTRTGVFATPSSVKQAAKTDHASALR